MILALVGVLAAPRITAPTRANVQEPIDRDRPDRPDAPDAEGREPLVV